MRSHATAYVNAPRPAAMVDIVVEVPRFGFLKRGSTGHLDFVSPLPCPFNYGSVPAYIGLEGDLLDAVVLGPRLAPGSIVRLPVWGAIGLSDRGLYDDKLICAVQAPCARQRSAVLAFFRFYGLCKRLLNLWRGRPGLTRCEGWVDPCSAIARCQPRSGDWQGPLVEF